MIHCWVVFHCIYYHSFFIHSSVNGHLGCFHTGWSKSEREKQISDINAYIWDLERHTDEPICKAAVEKQTKRTGSWTKAREEGEGAMNGESSMETYTLSYVNRQPRGICCVTRELQLGLCNSLEELGKVGGGRREGASRGRRHMYTYGSFMLMYDRNQTNTVNQP